MRLRTTSLGVISRRRFSGIIEALWNPSFLGSALQGWYNAKSASNFSLSGSTVTQWNDLSGKGNNVSALGILTANGVTVNYVSNGINNLPSVDFPWSDPFSQLGEAPLLVKDSSTVSSSGSLTYASVFQFRELEPQPPGDPAVVDESLWRPVVGVFDKPCEGELILQKMSGDKQIGVHDAGRVDTRVKVDVENSFNNAKIGVVTYDSTTSTVTVTATEPSQASYKSTTTIGWTPRTSTRIQIGGLQQQDAVNPVGGMNGLIGEVVICNQALSEVDRQKLEGYLAWEWNLQDKLPADHPYKTLRPTGTPTPIPPPWTPAELNTELFAWLDALDETTLTRTGSTNPYLAPQGTSEMISAWASKNTAFTGVNAVEGYSNPSIGPFKINGRQAVALGSGTSTLHTPMLNIGASAGQYTDPVSVWIVFSTLSPGSTSSRSVLALYNNSPFNEITGYGIVRNGPLYKVGLYESSSWIIDIAPLQFSQPILYGSINQNFNNTFRINGSTVYDQPGPTPLQTTMFDNVLLGSYDLAGTGRITGAVGEIIITKTQESLSIDNINKIEGYLAHKWGLIGQLPIDHPYRFTAP